MTKFLRFFKFIVTSGGDQNFLGAKWIPGFLNAVPAKRKKYWALRVLSFSPHYFGENKNGLSTADHLAAESNRNLESRKQIFGHILKPYLDKKSRVLDYGCGPGYLVRIVSDHVNKAYGYDISAGALACAKILNNASNLTYFSNGSNEATDLDLIYSIAVVYHVTDEVLDQILNTCSGKLKQDGTVLFHVKLDDPLSKTEQEWKADKSITGRLKYTYGLHYFARSEGALTGIFSRYFKDIKIEKVSLPGSDLDGEYILTARKLNG